MKTIESEYPLHTFTFVSFDYSNANHLEKEEKISKAFKKLHIPITPGRKILHEVTEDNHPPLLGTVFAGISSERQLKNLVAHLNKENLGEFALIEHTNDVIISPSQVPTSN